MIDTQHEIRGIRIRAEPTRERNVITTEAVVLGVWGRSYGIECLTSGGAFVDWVFVDVYVVDIGDVDWDEYVRWLSHIEESDPRHGYGRGQAGSMTSEA